MSFDLTEAFSQIVVSLVVIGAGWLLKLRKDVTAAHRLHREHIKMFHVKRKGEE
jgi:hypothetical protein